MGLTDFLKNLKNFIVFTSFLFPFVDTIIAHDQALVNPFLCKVYVKLWTDQIRLISEN